MHRSLISWFLASLLTLPAAALAANEDWDSLRHNVGIFGQDDRKEAYNNELYTAVHPLVTATGGTCSAILIGRNYALTASHCVANGSPRFIRIDRGTSWGETLPIAQVWSARNFQYSLDEYGREYLKEDFAILRLAKPAPRDMVPAEIAESSDVYVGQTAISVGYPIYTFETKTRVKDNNCSVRGLAFDIVRTDCAMSRGNSGGPLFVKTRDGKWKVAGVASTQYMYSQGGMVLGETYRDDKANYYTNITLYLERIRRTIRVDRAETGLSL